MTIYDQSSAKPQKPSVKLHAARFAKFLVVGVLNTAFGYTVFAAVWLMTQEIFTAIFIANVVGATFNYFTVGRLVFANRGFKALLPFLFGYLLILGLNLGLAETLTRMGFGALIAQLLAVPIMILFSFAYNSAVTFRGSGRG